MTRIITTAALRIIHRDQLLAPTISIAAAVGISVPIMQGLQVVTLIPPTTGAIASVFALQPPQNKIYCFNYASFSEVL